MRGNLKHTFAVMIAAILLGGAALSIGRLQRADHETQENANAPEGHKKEGLTLDRDTQERIGLEVQPLHPVMIRPEVVVYGTLEGDPSEEFVLRSPITGTLESQGQWPTVGLRLPEGADIGSVRPLFSPMDRIALSERLASARADLGAATASEAAATKEASRLKRLNAEEKNVSDKAVQESEAQLAGEQAKLRSAQASVDLISATLQRGSIANAARLEVQKGGQVTELAAQPGETVQAGAPLLRINRFDHLLARLYVPPGQAIPSTVSHAAIYPSDQPQIALAANKVALTASIDSRYQGQTWLFRVAAGTTPLRPGQAVTAHIPMPGPANRGLLVPSTAILRFQGATWVYTEQASGEFVRRPVVLDRPGKNGWLVTSGLSPGERVVVSGAQTLLSEQMKSELESDED